VGRRINVTAVVNADGWTCHVGIEEGDRLVSEHTVTVTGAAKERLAPASTIEDLVTRSFEFLLEREAPHNILQSFNLTDITRYFPEWEGVMSG
jgi:hypothetical protein